MSKLTDFGGDPTGLTDSTAALQTALNVGGYLELDGTFLVGSAGTWVTATKPVVLCGTGRDSGLIVSAAIPENYPVIRVSPTPYTSGFGYEFRNFFVQAATGAKACALTFDTTAAGQYIQKPIVDNLVISQMANQCITSTNTNSDGLAALQISNCILLGGVFLNNAGDSIAIHNNIISGSGISIFASFVAGAGCFSAYENNLTGQGGAIYLINALVPKLESNNIESVNYGYTGSVNTLVFLQNCIGSKFAGNVNSGNTADCIRLVNCINSDIDNSHLQVSGTAKKHIRTEGGSNNYTGSQNTYVDIQVGYVSGYFA